MFRDVLKLQQLFHSGEVRLSDGPGALSLNQFDRKREPRYLPSGAGRQLRLHR